MITASPATVTGPPQSRPAMETRLRALTTGGRRLLGRHYGVVILVGVGTVLRSLLIGLNWPAFWFSDSADYLRRSRPLTPGPWHPFGYSAWIRALAPLGGWGVVATAQHALGLSLVVIVYALLRHRGMPRWLSLIGAAPLALDGHLVVLEHYAMPDSLFLALVVGALALLLWHDRPRAWLVLGAGVLLVAASLVRTIGLPLCVLLGAYLLVRRLGWRQLLVYAAVLLLGLGGYTMWFHSSYHVYGFSRFSGRFLYARTATFADCDRLRLTAAQRTLCPTQPLDQRPDRADWFAWDPGSPAARYPSLHDDPLLKSFGMEVIKQQPADYLRVVSADTWRYVSPAPHLGAGTRCLQGYWELGYHTTAPRDCFSHVIQNNHTGQPVDRERAANTPLRASLAWYAHWGTVPGLVQVLIVLAALLAAVWRPFRRGWRDGADALLLSACGVTMIVVSFATTMYEPRYGYPAVPLFVLSGVFAWRRLSEVKRTPPSVETLPERNIDVGYPS